MKNLIKKIKNIKKETIYSMFYISYFMIIISDIFNDIVYLKNILNIIDIMVVIILVFIVFYGIIFKKIRFDQKNILLSIFFFITIVLVFTTKEKSILKLSLLLLASYDIDFNDFIEKDLFIRISLVVIIMCLFFLGLTTNGVLEVRNGFIRNSFGLGHPNSFAYYLSIICLDYFYISYINKEKMIKPIIFSILIIVFNIFFVGSRTNIILVLLFISLFLFFRNIKFENTITNNLIKRTFLIFLIFSICLAYFYRDNSVFFVLDKVLSKRISLASYYLNNYSIKYENYFVKK